MQSLHKGWSVVAIALREGVWMAEKARVKELLLAMLPATEGGQ